MASPHVLEFSDANWQSEVVASDKPVVVDFWGPACPPCVKLAPIIDRVAEQFSGRVKVGKVNVSDNADLATQYGISSIPRVLLFHGGAEPVRKMVGLVAEKDLVKAINAVLETEA